MEELVKKASDDKLLQHIKTLDENELAVIASYSIKYYRYRFLGQWLNNLVLPQITNVHSWISIIETLDLYRTRTIKHNPIPLLLALFRSKTVHKMYPIILKNENLRKELIKMAVSIPGGTFLLYREWKKYDYPIDIWNCLFTLNGNMNLKHTFEQICRYGNVKDIRIALKHPEWWGDTKPLSYIMVNYNINVFRYFMELVWTISKLKEIHPKIFKYSFISDWLTEHECFCALHDISYSKSHNKKYIYMIKMLRWLCDKCPILQIGLHARDRELLKDNVFHRYIKYQQPQYPKPEQILWIETQQPFLSPKVQGKGRSTITNWRPLSYHYQELRAVQVLIDNIYVRLVYDYNVPGLWNARINTLGAKHPYWKGPYSNLDTEDKDLLLFINTAKKNGWNKVWWPKGVYQVSGPDFFDVLSAAPTVSYPTDGWIIAGSCGALYKIILEPKTLRLLYYDDKFKFACYTVCTNVINEFPCTIEPENVPELYITNLIRATRYTCEQVTNCLTIVAYNTNNVISELWATIKSFVIFVNKKEFNWLLTTRQRPKGWDVKYIGPPIYEGSWECEWDNKMKKWRPIGRTYDQPHDFGTGIILTTFNKYPWSVGELKKYYNCRTPKIKKNYVRNDIKSFVHENYYSNYSYIGGYPNDYKNIHIDPYLVAAKEYYSENGKWFWGDPITGINPVTKKKYKFTNSVVIEDVERWFPICRLLNQFLRNTGIEQLVLIVNNDTYNVDLDGWSCIKKVKTENNAVFMRFDKYTQ